METTTTPIEVRFDNDLLNLIDQYAEGQQLTKTDFIRNVVLEKLEDMHDIATADQTYQVKKLLYSQSNFFAFYRSIPLLS